MNNQINYIWASDYSKNTGEGIFGYRRKRNLNGKIMGDDNNQGGKKNPVLETIMLAQGEQEFPNDGLPLKKHLADIEKNLIRLALQRAQGNISQTARLLNLQRTTLVEKINKYQLKSG